MSSVELGALTGAGIEKMAVQRTFDVIESDDTDVILVDYEGKDPDNPLNWTPLRKWSIALAISWMGFVR